MPLTINAILEIEAQELIERLGQEFTVHLPASIETVEDMSNAAKILSFCASAYSYLTQMKLLANTQKRILKKDKTRKEEYEDAVAKEAIFKDFAEIVKTNYAACSRLLTIKQQVNDELKMSNIY